MRVTESVILPSAARSGGATINTSEFGNPDGDGNVVAVEVLCELTAFTTAASLVVAFQEFNEGSGGWIDVLAGAALAAVGVKRLRLGFEVPALANLNETHVVGKRFRVQIRPGNSNSHTYSVVLKRLYDNT